MPNHKWMLEVLSDMSEYCVTNGLKESEVLMDFSRRIVAREIRTLSEGVSISLKEAISPDERTASRESAISGE